MRKRIASLVISSTLVLVTGCGVNQTGASNQANQTTGASVVSSGHLSVLYAGSMTKVMEQKIRPNVKDKLGIDFLGEGKGSTELAQMIRSGISTPDVFISASPSVNRQILMGKQNRNIVNWYLALAQDQLVIAYSPKSKFHQQLTQAASGQTAWYHVLGLHGFRLGRTDPVLDPKGLNTIFMFKLASRFYHQPNLEKQILGATENVDQVFPEESLLAQLTSGELDAIIAYKHEAVEWGTPYITLPSEVNLGNAALSKTYAQVTFVGKKGKVQRGAPIVFTITIPSTVSNENGAEAFVKYMVSGPGHQILMKDGFSAIRADVAGVQKEVPKRLVGLIQGKLS